MALTEIDPNKAPRAKASRSDGKSASTPKKDAHSSEDNAASPKDASDPVADPKWNCDLIRSMIETYLKSDNFTAKDFQKLVHVQPKSFTSFMQQKGPHAGVKNPIYAAAHKFFLDQEDLTKMADRTPKKNENKSFDANSLPKLEGEETGKVPIYDTCNDVRAKINRHLRNQKGASQAALARELSKCIPSSRGPVSAASVASFLKKNGHLAGNTSAAFYAGYVYFEKLRLRDGKPKSKKREEMEVVWAEEGGVQTDRDPKHMHMTLPQGTHWWINKYGQPEDDFQYSGRGLMQIFMPLMEEA